jgi:dolichyl-phosphate beta-glucosyltransferase
VIVPAYNERDRIEIMVDEAMTYILESIYGGDIHDTKSHHDLESRDDWKGEGTKKEWFEDGVEVVVVDDGSKDDTARVTIDLAGRWHKVIQDRQAIEKKKEGGQGKKWPRVDIRIIKLEKNRGKGGAVRHVRTSSSSFPFFLHSSITLVIFNRESYSLEANVSSLRTQTVLLDSPT